MTTRQMRKALPSVDRFLVREARLKEAIGQVGGAEALRTRAGGVNPHAFAAYKNPATGRWLPPRLSLRRQAQLGKDAVRAGRFDELVGAIDGMHLTAGPKLNRMRERIAELAEQKAELSARQAEVHGTAAEPAIAAQAHVHVGRTQAREQARKLAIALAATRGPYRGRSMRTIFKGTKAERRAPARRREIATKLAKMDQTVSSWRKVSRNMAVMQAGKRILIRVLFSSRLARMQRQRRSPSYPSKLCHTYAHTRPPSTIMAYLYNQTASWPIHYDHDVWIRSIKRARFGVSEKRARMRAVSSCLV